MKTLEAKPFDQNAENWKRETSTVYIDRARGRRLGAKSNRYARTQKSSNSLIRFRCSDSCFLLEIGIADHEKLFLAKWHPKPRKNCEKGCFSTPLRGMKVVRSIAAVRQRPRTPPNWRCSLAFSSLSFDISIKNSVQRWSSDFQGLFCVKIRKMAQGSNDLSTLQLIIMSGFTTGQGVVHVAS